MNILIKLKLISIDAQITDYTGIVSINEGNIQHSSHTQLLMRFRKQFQFKCFKALINLFWYVLNESAHENCFNFHKKKTAI